MSVVYFIPNGPKNISQIFTSIDIRDIDEYYVQALGEGDAILATSTLNKIDRCEDAVRIHFINSLGCIDGITMEIANIKHSPKSETYKKQLSSAKSNHSIGRFNVRANDVITAKTVVYGEGARQWLDELFDSPLAWVEFGTPKELIPIVISDTDRDKIKETDRFQYEISLEYTMSHEKYIIRN